MPDLTEKVNETREQKLERARELAASITKKSIAAGITDEELEKNTYKSHLGVCREREIQLNQDLKIEVREIKTSQLEKLIIGDNENRQQYLQRARILHNNISEKMAAVGITHREIEEDVILYGKDNMCKCTVDQRPCSPTDSLRQSLKEINLVRNDKLPKRTWDDFLKDTEKKGRLRRFIIFLKKVVTQDSGLWTVPLLGITGHVIIQCLI